MKILSEALGPASRRAAATATVNGSSQTRRLAGAAHRSAGSARLATRAKRISGVDVARGLAVIGMLAVHVGPDGLENIFAGRDVALFVFLSGLSIALLSGGANAPRGRAAHLAAVRVAV